MGWSPGVDEDMRPALVGVTSDPGLGAGSNSGKAIELMEKSKG